MVKTLREELRQDKPFGSAEEEVFLNVIRTAEALTWPVADLFRKNGLSLSQYNVLRIVRGAGTKGICSRDILERMVTRDSDMTRLLDGLEQRELVRRVRSENDRRIVRARITRMGAQLLERLAGPLEELHRSQLGHLTKTDLRRLSKLLEAARSAEA